MPPNKNTTQLVLRDFTKAAVTGGGVACDAVADAKIAAASATFRAEVAGRLIARGGDSNMH
jgi:uncharacterized Zn-binding protein involved in type VI secretion